MGFVDVMKSFVLSPGEETLAPLQAEIMAAANYDPLVRLESVVSPLVDSGDHQGVVDAVWRMLPGVFLSPTAHAMLAHSYDKLGDEKAARRETKFARLALDALMSSGDGTQDAPYQVLRVSDEHDVLCYVQRTFVAQRVVVVDGHGYDVHLCSDGSEGWFKLLWQTS